jgi:hypothetical protein
MFWVQEGKADSEKAVISLNQPRPLKLNGKPGGSEKVEPKLSDSFLKNVHTFLVSPP